jgi:hypothetical protein
MIINKTNFIVFCVGIFLGLCTGFFTGKAIYDKPLNVGIKRDTIIVTDTIPQYFPQPVEVEKVRTEYKWLTRIQHVGKTDTLLMRDSVLVEVPIESKHYHANEYDAWVSGYEPSLDSIKVYQRTEYITETITKTTRRKPWGIGFHAGYGYDFRTKTAAPFVGVGISYDIISF